MIWVDDRVKIEINNEDCLHAMRKMKDNEFDLAIVDPPYGHGRNIISNNKSRSKLAVSKDYGSGRWNNNTPNEKYFKELLRVSKHQIIWGVNYYHYYFGVGRVVWDKVNGHNDFSDCEIAYQSFSKSIRMFHYMWNGMLQENMKNKERRIHPTQKPVALYKWLLKNYAQSGWKILDTHLGSGSIAIACYDMGFDLVGYEIDRDYYDAAYNRFKKHTMQLSFDYLI